MRAKKDAQVYERRASGPMELDAKIPVVREWQDPPQWADQLNQRAWT